MGGAIAGLIDFAKSIFIWAIRLSFMFVVVFGFLAILNFAISLVFVTMNQTVLNDLFALVQIGLPFNLNVLLGWLLAAVSMWIFYRLALVAVTFLNRVLGNT